MAHNQMQFQKIYKSLGLTMKKCPCYPVHGDGFAQVDYYKGKRIAIYHRCQQFVLILNRDECPWVKSEEEFVQLAVEKWNKHEFTSC